MADDKCWIGGGGGGGGGRCHLFVSNSNLSLNWLDSGVADDKCWIGGGEEGGRCHLFVSNSNLSLNWLDPGGLMTDVGLGAVSVICVIKLVRRAREAGHNY